jgi:radical SAM protein with 4Fe4S-binding SPASM domain
MAKSPDVFIDMMRGIYKKHVSSVIDYYTNDGRSRSLWLVSMRITNLCNQRCAICAQWGENGYNFDRPNTVVRRQVDVETYRRMVDDVADIKPHIYITGGEPFLYKGLVPLVNYMKEKKLNVQIVTNGVGLEKWAEEMVENEWDALCVSLDGPREVHDECRGLRGAYDTLKRGVQKIQALRLEQGRRKPYIITLTTISSRNASILAESLDEAEKLNPDGMIVYYSWFTTEAIGQKHVAIMEEKLGCTPAAWRGYVINRNEIDLDALVENIKTIKSRTFNSFLHFIPALKVEDIPTYYLQPGNLFGYERCVAPWFMVDIMPNGDVVTCRDHPDYIVGNICEDSLLNLYNNERYRAFRRALKSCDQGLFPICARCCGLMGF